ncbi:MAG: diguanylate cyclase, partial [Methylovulum sp.]|nr:diguanylate cyclase [Methylovulum sp.]
ISIAIGAAFIALYTAFRLQNKHSSLVVLTKLASAVVLGGAISGMHYTGMAAAHFAPHSVSLAGDATGLSHLTLAAIVAQVTFLVLIITLATSAFDSYFAIENAKLAASLQAANERLQGIAYYDHLTGLPSRLLLEDYLNNTISRAGRNRTLFACLFIDLNKFKPVNDTFGHRVGDELLVAVARRLQNCVRKEDIVARIGGDEFVVVLSKVVRESDVLAINEKILETIEQVFHIENHTIAISCSIGISLYPRDGESADILVAHADKAMYQVKPKGGPAVSK